MKGCLGFVLGVLLLIAGGGVWQWYQGRAAADTYAHAAKERFPAVVVSALFPYGPQDLVNESPTPCQVTLRIADRIVTTDADPLSGACDDNTPLRPGTAVSVEIYQGKVTAIYLGSSSWPTTDNPGHENLIPQAQTFFAVILAVPVVGLLILDVAVGGLIEWLRRRHVLPAKRPTTRPAATDRPPPDMHIYPPE
ncbi:MAG TPA: hypothetical protein VGV88_09705 [Candidatus Dormibacteraeota bacterium]|nr:hypothetical protein [Candidatus Dormibacteraeota bacterium]